MITTTTTRSSFLSVEPQNSIPIPDLKKGIEDEMKGDCAKYVNQLLDAVAKNTRVDRSKLTLSDIFSQSKLNILPPRGRPGSIRIGGGEATGSISAGTATINIYQMYQSVFDLQHLYVLQAFHETIHLSASSGAYTDEQLANAAFGLLTPEEQKKNKLPNPPANASAYDRADAFSHYWDGLLTTHCK